MTKILLTGFEPFLDYKVNPTMQVVEALNGVKIEEYEIVSRTMVVDFEQSATQFKQYIEEVKPSIIISLGLAGGRYKITPERIAINVKDGEPDNNGYTPIDEAIYDGEPDGHFTNLPIRNMVNTLKEAGYPSTISNSAGTYLCNNIMYEGIRYAKSQNHVFAGFIHIPANFELSIAHGKIPGWHTRDLVDAVKLCIEESVREAKR